MIQTPKQRFQGNTPVREAWHSIARSQQFIDACDAAMMELLTAQPMFADAAPETTAELAQFRVASAQLRMEGARLFRNVLENLGEIPKPAEKTNIHNLKHDL